MKPSIRLIKRVLNGKSQIIVETENELYVYYTKVSLTYSYGEWYFYDDQNSFRFKDYKKKWFISKN